MKSLKDIICSPLSLLLCSSLVGCVLPDFEKVEDTATRIDAAAGTGDATTSADATSSSTDARSEEGSCELLAACCPKIPDGGDSQTCTNWNDTSSCRTLLCNMEAFYGTCSTEAEAAGCQ